MIFLKRLFELYNLNETEFETYIYNNLKNNT